MAVEIKKVLLNGGTVIEARNGIQPFVVDLMKPSTCFVASQADTGETVTAEAGVVVAAPDLSPEATRILLQAAGVHPTIVS